jgi:serine/threonine protein phosphatase PrpC
MVNGHMNIITFYTHAIGSSHSASGRPCQDNGTHYQNEKEDDVYIAIVCDGHGGDSYVRSDKGSQFAAEIAKEKILEFVKSPQTYLLLKGVKGAITAVTLQDPRKDNQGQVRDISQLSEDELDLLKQSRSYAVESQKYPEIEQRFRTLFDNIHKTWLDRIRIDAQEHEFTKIEKDKLRARSTEKAYGTTLMAAVRTKDYWFAFHLGDGKLYVCDELMQWREPVPWDCNCFLNFTTSLCDSSPVNEFRYAFDGTGNFPVAFALGSDGIDDTFIKQELIHKFYSQLLKVFYERDTEEAVNLLTASLLKLSVRGSHDDMSVAAIIDKDKLPKALEYYDILSEVRTLNHERDQKQQEIDLLSQKIEAQEKDIENKKDEANSFLSELISHLKEYSGRQKAISLARENLNNQKKEKNSLEIAFQNWKEQNRKYIAELRLKAEKIKNEIIVSQPMECGLSVREVCAKNVHRSEPFANSNPDATDTALQNTIARPMTEEGIRQMDKDSEAQINDILK